MIINPSVEQDLSEKLGKNETAAAAKKLETARTIHVNLASTTAKPFNGTADVTPGVTGVLGTGNGGLGNNSGYIRTGQKSGTTIGSNATAEGTGTTASGNSSHAEGSDCSATGDFGSHAEGLRSKASGRSAHVEGEDAEASGWASHAEGIKTVASGAYSHAEGNNTSTSNSNAHAEGAGTKAIGNTSHAEGSFTIAEGNFSHAEGSATKATGLYSHAEGLETVAKGSASTAIGARTIASKWNQLAMGHGNVESTSSADFLIIGKGTYSSSSGVTRANCFRATETGVYATGPHNTTGADYAELFEWSDGNPDHSDRCGRFVTLDGERIRLAGPEDDFILGIVSGNPSVVGDVHDDQWQGMFLTDIFGRPLYEDVEVPDLLGPDSEVILPAHMEHRQKLNPDYDSSQPYQPRSQRPEWDAVGLLGKLVALDDGSCQINGWCTVGAGGVAVHSDVRTKYRVMARLDENHVRVLIL